MTGDVIFDGTENSNQGSDVAETSKQAYKQLMTSGEGRNQKRKVLEALQAMKYLPTIDELVHETLDGWEKSTVSGRLNDLKDLDLVSDLCGDAKRESNYSGIKSKVWSVTDKGESVLEEISE